MPRWIWIALFLWLALDTKEARAFRIGMINRNYQHCMINRNYRHCMTDRSYQHGVRYTFKLPRTQFDLAKQHIHTPEHVAAAPHLRGLPCVRIVGADPPTCYSNHAMVRFNYTSFLGPGQACMFTARPDECNLFLTDAQARPLFLVRLAVAPDPDNPRGHLLFVYGEFLRPPTWIQGMLAPAFLRAHATEDRALYGRRVPGEDMNLRQYRAMVLQIN